MVVSLRFGLSGEVIECDTVLLCAGIKPNVELARDAKLRVANGIVVNDQLQTVDENIWAVGECCEHQGLTYGLVNPGYEQAAIAADAIAQGASSYSGSLTLSRLKVMGEDVVSMGEVVDLLDRPLQREVSFLNKRRGIYRKLIILKGKVIGAVGFGSWPEMNHPRSL